MIDRFTAMQVFARVARLGGFSTAARELHMSATAVSRYVGQLEDHLEVRLLQRTTRRVSLTDAGSAYLERCEQLLAELAELEDGVGAGRRQPRGRLRVSAGVSFAQEQLHAAMPAFVERYPELEVELHLSDRYVDLVGEGFDVAVRIGRLPDSSLIARRLGASRHVVCASPDYIARRGCVETPAQLVDHDCILDTNQSSTWWFEGPEGELTHVARGRYRVNSAHGACDAAIAGLGLAYLPTFVASSRVVAGLLSPQLPDYRTAQLSLYAIYPENRYLSAGVRAFVDMLVERFCFRSPTGDEPPWDRAMFEALLSSA